MSYLRRDRLRRRIDRRRARTSLVLGVVVLTGLSIGACGTDQAGGDSSNVQAENDASAPAGMDIDRRRKPATGKPLTLKLADGNVFILESAGGGVSAEPLPGRPPAPAGKIYPYADYVLTNVSNKPVPLDYPADLYLVPSRLPASVRKNCEPLRGSPDSSRCTPWSESQVIARLGEAGAPYIDEAGDTILPAGGSYLVRIVSEVTLPKGFSPADISMYVSAARFTGVNRNSFRLDPPFGR